MQQKTLSAIIVPKIYWTNIYSQHQMGNTDA